jgi:ferritin-like metal-binding protein YciE
MYKRTSSDLLVLGTESQIKKIEILVKDGDILKEHKVNLIDGVIEDGEDAIIEPAATSILEMIIDS